VQEEGEIGDVQEEGQNLVIFQINANSVVYKWCRQGRRREPGEEIGDFPNKSNSVVEEEGEDLVIFQINGVVYKWCCRGRRRLRGPGC
jgi:hypothetical protein